MQVGQYVAKNSFLELKITMFRIAVKLMLYQWEWAEE